MPPAGVVTPRRSRSPSCRARTKTCERCGCYFTGFANGARILVSYQAAPLASLPTFNLSVATQAFKSTRALPVSDGNAVGL